MRKFLRVEKIEDYVSFGIRIIVIVLSTIALALGQAYGFHAPWPLLRVLLHLIGTVASLIGVNPEGLVWAIHGILSLCLAIGKGFKVGIYLGVSAGLLVEGITFYWGIPWTGPIVVVLSTTGLLIALWLDHNDWSIKK